MQASETAQLAAGLALKSGAKRTALAEISNVHAIKPEQGKQQRGVHLTTIGKDLKISDTVNQENDAVLVLPPVAGSKSRAVFQVMEVDANADEYDDLIEPQMDLDSEDKENDLIPETNTSNLPVCDETDIVYQHSHPITTAEDTELLDRINAEFVDEKEYFDITMAAEYSDEIFEYMRELEVSDK